MTSSKAKITFVLGIVLTCTALSATDYYKQTFFPIGFTGFDHTGFWQDPENADASPYPDGYAIGLWSKEDSLLQLTHCNFIGCSDGDEYYYLKADPSLTDPDDRTDFYNKVCLPSGIMLASNAGYMPKRVDWNDDDTFDTTDPNEHLSPRPMRWWIAFRFPDDGGWAPYEFKDCPYNQIPEKDIWGPMADGMNRFDKNITLNYTVRKLQAF